MVDLSWSAIGLEALAIAWLPILVCGVGMAFALCRIRNGAARWAVMPVVTGAVASWLVASALYAAPMGEDIASILTRYPWALGVVACVVGFGASCVAWLWRANRSVRGDVRHSA